MRCCAAAGATASKVEQSNTIVWLRMMSDPIKLPVLPDRAPILPELGAMLKPAHQVVEAGYGDDWNSVAQLDFLDGRKISLAPLHPVEGDDYPRRGRALPRDQLERIAHRGARRQYIIHNQNPAGKRGADEFAAFPVTFYLLAVEGEGHVAAFAGESHRGARGKDDALIGGAEQHVEAHPGGEDRFCVELRQALERGSGVEQAGVEKVWGRAPRLGDEPAEPEHALLDAEGDEVLAKVGHAGFFQKEFAECYALSRSTSTASAPRSPKAFRGGSRASAPTSSACRRSRRRNRTWRTSRSSRRDITATITAARRRRATAASRCTREPSPRAYPAASAAPSSTPRADFCAPITAGFRWYRCTCLPGRARRKGSRRSSGFSRNSCRCLKSSSRAAASSCSAATGTSRTGRST